MINGYYFGDYNEDKSEVENFYRDLNDVIELKDVNFEKDCCIYRC